MTHPARADVGRRRAELPPAGDDRGSILPMVTGCFVVAALMVCGAIAASAAFLAQRDLASVCDGAAVAAASAVDEGRVYAGGAADQLPLDAAGVQVAVDEHLSRTPPPSVTAATGTDGETVTVVCRRTVAIPFGAVFGFADGLEREATAHARSPLRG